LIVLLEPPRPEGLPSGGFRYQQAIVDAIGHGARRTEVPADQLHRRVRQLQANEPDAQIVVDGWFADLCDEPLPAGVVALLHMVPARTEWRHPSVRVIATGQPTAQAIGADAHLVRPGVDACFVPAARRGDATFAIICAGTICPAKGQRRLLAALRDIEPAWRLTFVGSTTHDPTTTTALRADAAGLPVTIRDAVTPAELHALYAEHDLFASLSDSESYGMAAREAVAVGLPLFGLRTGELHTFGAPEARWLLPVDADDEAVRSQLRELLRRGNDVRARRDTAPPPQRTWQQAAREFVAAIRAAD